MQTLKTNYTKELITTSLQNINKGYMIFIPPRRGWTITIYDDQLPGEIQTYTRWTQDFSPEVHVLTVTLVPVVSTDTW
jgi:hypothetical protein